MEAWTKITQRLCDKLVKFFQAMRSWVVFHSPEEISFSHDSKSSF